MNCHLVPDPTPARLPTRTERWSAAIRPATLVDDARRADACLPGDSLLDRFVGRLESRFVRSFGHAANLGGLLGRSPRANSPEAPTLVHQLWDVLQLGVRSLLGVIWGAAATTALTPWLLLGAAFKSPTLLGPPQLAADRPALAVLLQRDLGCSSHRRALTESWRPAPQLYVAATDTPIEAWWQAAEGSCFDFTATQALGRASELAPPWQAAVGDVCAAGIGAAARHVRFGAQHNNWSLDPRALSDCVQACWSVARPVADQQLVRVECHALFDEPVPLLSAGPSRAGEAWLYPHPLHIRLTIDIDQPAVGLDEDPAPWSLAPGGEPVVDAMAYAIREQVKRATRPVA